MYRKVDKKAPRFRLSKYRYISINRELFERFRQAHPNIKMDYLVFKDIICNINEEFVNYALDNREGVFLPAGMGRIYLAMFKMKEKRINEAIAMSNGLTRKYFDLSSDLNGKIVWKTFGVRYKVEETQFYGFIAHRTFKNRASKAFRETPENFLFEAQMIKTNEIYKRINNERAKANSQICDQSSEDTEQSGEF